MGGAPSGARDANAFHAAVRCGGSFLPPPSSLTYQGLFNQHTYHTGEPEKSAEVAVAARAGRVPAVSGGANIADGDVWVGCFLKSCRDGSPRDAAPIDVVAVLDVSGSMSFGVGSHEARPGQSRLELAKRALLGLVARLRDDDRFGLATFNLSGEVVQTLQRVEELDRSVLETSIDGLRPGGGTTLQAGMDAALGICEGAERPSGPRHRRLLFLTDMHDLGSKDMDAMIELRAKDGLFVSFICIGMEFNSQLAEQVTKHRGANYFCITRDEELQKVVVDDFDFNFFPAAFEVEVAQQSDALDLVAVYGTPYDTRQEVSGADWRPSAHRFYPPEFKEQARELLLCSGRSGAGSLPSPALQQLFGFLSPSARTVVRVDTVFPSAVREDGSVEGGLILLRLRPRSGASGAGVVRLMTRYVSAAGGSEQSTTEDVCIPAPGPGAAEPDAAVVKGVLLQRFVEACKAYLTTAEERAQERVAEVRAAFAGVQALLEELDAAKEKVDSLCPGLRGELRDFSAMAQEHLAMVDKQVAGKAADRVAGKVAQGFPFWRCMWPRKRQIRPEVA